MHFRSVLITITMCCLCLPVAVAQKKIQATVNPNADTYNTSADLFVPSSETFTATTGSLAEPREDQAAVVLADGRVLVAGGRNNRYLNTAEIFDPSTGTFEPNYQTFISPITGLETTARGNLQTARSGAGSVLLLDGTVLIAGGFNGNYLGTSEIYNPRTGAFRNTTSAMRAMRYRPGVTLLKDGKVLITGGVNSAFLSSAEIYSPFTGFFTLTSYEMTEARVGHTATLMNDGTVLIVGGCANADVDKIVCDAYSSSAEIYDPVEDTFESTGSLHTGRAEHTASLLPDGRVLIVGGTDGNSLLSSAEIYDPETGTFTNTGNMTEAKEGHTASVLQDGRVLIAGGFSGNYLAGAEIFDPSSETFSAVASSMSTQRLHHTASVLQDGSVLLSGGSNSNALVFDVNARVSSDNVSPDIVFSPDSQTGFVPYTGSGIVVAFSSITGEILERIETEGNPAFITPLPDGDRLAIVSTLDNRIFIISMETMSLEETYTFADAEFGFGSRLVLSPDGTRGFISSTGTGEVIQFDVETGIESGRLEGLETPAQITVTPDGNTLIVVETTTAELYFVDTGSMDTEFVISLRDVYGTAGLTIYNKAVLDPEGETGIIGTWDIEGTTPNVLFYFNVSTGDVLETYQIGSNPAFTTLTPDGENWIILGDADMTLIPVDDIESGVTTAMPGTPLSSANTVFSGDSGYAFYAASSIDRVQQVDLASRSVVGAYQVGDNSFDTTEQPARMAISPDSETISVLNFISNEVDLFVDATMIKVPEFINDRDQFTGITLINLSENPANLSMKAYNHTGTNTFLLSDGNLTAIDSVALGTLPPMGQLSLDLSRILDLDDTVPNQGHLEITSDQSAVVGFAVTGNIGTTFLDTYLSGMNGMSLYRFPDSLHDWISPDISIEELQEEIPGTEFVITNPNYNDSNYEIIHYGADGSQLEGNTGGVVEASVRDVLTLTDLFDSTHEDTVLIIGGRNPSVRRSSELFFPDNLSFNNTGSMRDVRYGHAASLLPSGRVLVTGGRDGVRVLDSAEVYNPITGLFISIKGTMVHPRYRHTSTRLNDGTVLVAGGQNSISINATAEIYDPVENTFRLTSEEMTSPRDGHTATLLPDGRVLLVGGIDGYGVSSTAEIYDPVTSTFTATGSMSTGRAFHKAVLLQDGRVLIAGGYNGSYLASAEIYDPETGIFTVIPSMNEARSDHTATLLPDGSVLITGGRNSSGVLDSVEFFYPFANQFSLSSRTMTSPRALHTATPIGGGKVLLVTGTTGYEVAADSEIYYPESQAFSSVTTSQAAMSEHTATLLRGLIAGYLRGSSERGVLFRQESGANARRIGTDGIDIERFEGITDTYTPYFITKSPFRTKLDLINTNEDQDAIVTVLLHGFDGSLLSEPVSVQLPADNQINEDLVDFFANDPAILEQEGWLEVQSTVDRIVGYVSLGKIGGNILAAFPLSTAPLNDFVFPLSSENDDFATEMSLLNTAGQSATVQIELWGADGVMDASTTLNLPANASIDGFLGDYFSADLNRLYGYIRIISTQPLHSYSILWGLDEEFACGMPPIPVPEQ